MTRMKTKCRYSPEDYDKFVCLKPDAEMWLAMIYLSHGIVFVMIYFVSVFRMKGGRSGFEYLGDISPMLVVGSLPAILVIWAYIKRAPGERGKILWIWKNGRSLLMFSCAIYLLRPLMTFFPARHFNTTASVLLIVDLVVLVYLALSTRVKDVFSEYPDNAA